MLGLALGHAQVFLLFPAFTQQPNWKQAISDNPAINTEITTNMNFNSTLNL